MFLTGGYATHGARTGERVVLSESSMETPCVVSMIQTHILVPILTLFPFFFFCTCPHSVKLVGLKMFILAGLNREVISVLKVNSVNL